MRLHTDIKIDQKSPKRLANLFEYWIKNNRKPELTDTENFLIWLYSEQEYIEIENAEQLSDLINKISSKGYNIDSFISENQLYEAFKNAEKNIVLNIHKNTFFPGKIETQNKQNLKNMLQTAFRTGISTALLGMTKLAVSDHIPVTVKFNEISFVGWNLLTDEHTDNFLLDIGEKSYYSEMQGIECRSLFESFGHYIFNNNEKNAAGIYEILINNETLHAFVDEAKLKVKHLKEKMALSVENKALESDLKQASSLAESAEKWIQLVMNPEHPNHRDMKNSLIHILEIMSSRKDGPLRWENRLKKLKENKSLVKALASHDFLCFQECTKPEDMLNLLHKTVEEIGADKKFAMLSNKVRENSLDNCVIIYDENKFNLLNKIDFGLYVNPSTSMPRKPCIAAKFLSVTDKKPLIVGSVHHSGRGKNEIAKIIEVAENLKDDLATPVMILGDYNHQKEHFTHDLINTDYKLLMPVDGTMAGFEHGNNNKAIDGVTTNCPLEVNIQVLQQNTFAQQVRLPLDIHIEIDSSVKKAFIC